MLNIAQLIERIRAIAPSYEHEKLHITIVYGIRNRRGNASKTAFLYSADFCCVRSCFVPKITKSKVEFV
jgi:hypothetical protein